MKQNLFTLSFKNLIKISVVVFITVILLFFLNELFMPKYTGKMVEGRLIGEYYDSEKNNHVIFLGDSEMYYNFSPAVLKEEYDLNAYVRGSANQTIWQSYYILEDTLRYEKPDTVVLSVSGMMKGVVDGEAYNRMTIDGMEWSESKYECIKASMGEEEYLLSYVFPLFRYHSRWSELEKEDFTEMFSSENVSERGYIKRTEIVPLGTLPSVKPLDDYTFPEKCMEYLNKIKKLCKDNEIKLILVKSPSLYPHWYQEWDNQVVNYCEKYDITYINLLHVSEAIGLDWEVDTFDGGLHLNASGAEKNTRYFGKYLQEE